METQPLKGLKKEEGNQKGQKQLLSCLERFLKRIMVCVDVAGSRTVVAGNRMLVVYTRYTDVAKTT